MKTLSSFDGEFTMKTPLKVDSWAEGKERRERNEKRFFLLIHVRQFFLVGDPFSFCSSHWLRYAKKKKICIDSVTSSLFF